MSAIPITGTVDDVLKLAIETGFSRFPVYDEQGIDHVVGVLLIKELLSSIRQELKGDGGDLPEIRSIMREPFYIPESKLIIDVFKDLKRSKNHLAVVIDEHGGTAGIVTMEDILEEIVGEIQDEYDLEEAEFLEIEPGIYDVAGSASTDDVLEFFNLEEDEHIDKEEQDFDTLAGWVSYGRCYVIYLFALKF